MIIPVSAVPWKYSIFYSPKEPSTSKDEKLNWSDPQGASWGLYLPFGGTFLGVIAIAGLCYRKCMCSQSLSRVIENMKDNHGTINFGDVVNIYSSNLESKDKSDSPAQLNVIFDQNDWKDSFGTVGKQLPLPSGINAVLEENCPFIRGKKVKDTHILVFIPRTLRGVSLNLNEMQKLTECTSLKLELTKEAQQVLGNPWFDKPYWMLITKEFIPNTEGKTLDYQIKQLKKKKFKQLDYEMPCALEIVANLSFGFFR